MLKKGARAYFSGTMRMEEWTDEDSGEIRSEMRLSADYFFIDSMCVENVIYREKKQQVTSGVAA